MAKLESAAEFIALVESGKYETKVNAQRGCGRTRLTDTEKKKAFAFIDKYFPEDGSTPAAKPSKKVVMQGGKKLTRMAKKAKKVGKKVRAVVPVEDYEEPAQDESEEEVADEETPKSGKKAKKKAARRAPAGALALSPGEAKSVADILTIVDSTVASSMSVINALRAAQEVSSGGDINRGIELIKLTLEGTANLLHQSVVTPLAGTVQADPDVAARLSQIVAASEVPPAQSWQAMGDVPNPIV